MKIEFLTQDDPIYILPFFEEFFRHYASEFEVLQVSASRAMGKRPRGQLMKELACLYGPLGFLRISARAVSARLLASLPRQAGAARYGSMTQLCRAYRIPFRRIGTPNSAEFVEAARQRGADLIASVACPFILKETLLGLPRLGCVNIHHAPVPRYKGMMPTFWQMYHGERKIGVTVHYMAAKVDEGAALLQEELEIQPTESLDKLIQRSKRHGAHCMAEVFRQIAAGTQRVTKLKNDEGSYFTFPTIEQIRDFHRRGLRAI
jgi:methionyl-tRNA formyltransferase